jgi:hypothetical protein
VHARSAEHTACLRVEVAHESRSSCAPIATEQTFQQERTCGETAVAEW